MSNKRRRRSPLSGLPARLWPDAVLHHGLRVLLVLGLGALLVWFFPFDPGVGLGRYRLGTVADRDLIAEVGFRVVKDPEVIARDEEAAQASVIPVFSFEEDARDSTLVGLRTFFVRMDSARVAGGRAAVADLFLALGVVDADTAVTRYLTDSGNADLLHSQAASAIRAHLPRGVMDPGAASQVETDSIRVVRGSGEDVVHRSSVLSGRDFFDVASAELASLEAGIMRTILARHLVPSLVLDLARTDRERSRARDTVTVELARVLEGEAIVRANEQVGQTEWQKLRAYQDQLAAQGIRVEGQNIGGSLGNLVIGTLLLGIFGVLLLFFQREIYQSFRAVLTIAGIFTVYFLAVYLAAGQELPASVLPIVFVAVPLAVLWDGRVALLAALVLASLTTVQGDFATTPAFVTVLTGGATAALSVRKFRRLSQTWGFILIIAGAYVVTLTGLFLRGAELDFVSWVWGALGSTVVGAILAVGFLPVFEWFTGVTTDQTLIGWADPNRPLMRRLAREAPGTYAHTIQVANLAEAGADAIGANALLCRAGAYYHDVGKVVNPPYFIENRQGGNPHDSLEPLDSARIIREHVVEGIRMAKAENVPKIIRDFIPEHHGDQTIGFFLERARKVAEEKGEEPPDPEQFRYPGPRPQSREAAIMMLADSVESACRSLKNPTEERIQRLIQGIFSDERKQRQLEQAPVTLRDLDLLKKCFVATLGGIHHQRIDYPETKHLTAGDDTEDGDGESAVATKDDADDLDTGDLKLTAGRRDAKRDEPTGSDVTGARRTSAGPDIPGTPTDNSLDEHSDVVVAPPAANPTPADPKDGDPK